MSSSNKCIEGVPGFAFAICKKSELLKAKGQARSLSLDLYDQWLGSKRMASSGLLHLHLA
jgi:2-aminoethylphosphonate-pyruvate transaminase